MHPTLQRPSRTRQLFWTLSVYPLLGVLSAVLVGMALSVTVDPRSGTMLNATAFDGEANWTATQWRTAVAVAIEASRNTGASWSPWQATGAPNTPNQGDSSSAWATQQQDAPGEWLELTYATAVVPKAVHVYENYAPGAVVRITAFRAEGAEVDAWVGKDPTPANSTGVGISKIPLSANFPTSRIRVYIDSVAVTNWNEIDAVGLVDASDNIQWAIRAKASSAYGGGQSDPLAPSVRALLPGWSKLTEPGAAFASGKTTLEARGVVAWGWPMPVVMGEIDLLTATAPPGQPQILQLGSTNSIYTNGTISTYTMPPGPTTPLSGAVPNISLTRTAVTGFIPTLGGAPAPGSLPLPSPRRVIWLGLVVNGALYAVVLFLLRIAIIKPLRFFSEVGRMRRGCCIGCGYDLGYDFVRGCPECGWRRIEACRIGPTDDASRASAQLR